MVPSDRSSIIVWSSDWTQTTGQAIVTRRVVECQIRIDWIPACYGRGLQSVVGIFRAAARTYSALLARRASTVYVVGSRSLLGFLRDVPALATSLTGARVVVHIHGSDLEGLLSTSPLALLARVLYERCEIIVPSTHLVDDLQRVTHAPIHLCENFVPMMLENLAPHRAVAKDGPLIVWNSNIMASKGFFDLAEAVRIALPEVPGLQMVSLGAPMGDVEMTSRDAKIALEQLCCEPWFTYFGSVSPEEAYRRVAAADFYVFPSRHECQPLALVQAMCLGRPIIVNDTPALRATLGDYPAVLLPAPDPRSLAKAIQVLAKSGPPAGLEAAAERARARFSPHRFDREMAIILDGRAS